VLKPTFKTLAQKFGSLLCSHASIRASRVVMNGFLLIYTSREAPVLSFRITGELPTTSASRGMR
jgi:hypothetical protein